MPKKNRRPVLFVSTRKGAFLYYGDPARRTWKVDGPHFLGAMIHHTVLDPRDGRTIVMAARTGHLGPTVYRSSDWGKTWKEASKPPAFPKAEGGRTVDHVFWLTPGHASEKNTWYAGTSPQGLFRSEDGGDTWSGDEGFNGHPDLEKWTLGFNNSTPDGAKLHSILVDPRDARHLYVGMSAGGTFESADAGASWKPLNRGVAADFLPDKDPEYGHDAHCTMLHPLKPDRLYQQNHCGIYRIDRPSDTWERIGRNMPKEIGDIGFPMVLHPRDPDTAWVFPMDGREVWPRVPIGGKPAVYVTKNAGKSWKRQDQGMPKTAWWTVKRQAMVADDGEPVGLYFGTTNGDLWLSRDEGAKWAPIASHLPHIYAVSAGAR